MKLPLTGGCQCGALRYEITPAPSLVYTCHCTDCQRLTSSAFSSSSSEPLIDRRLDGGLWIIAGAFFALIAAPSCPGSVRRPFSIGNLSSQRLFPFVGRLSLLVNVSSPSHDRAPAGLGHSGSHFS
jgi:hypothetical protein